MIAVLFGLIVITLIAFFAPSFVTDGTQDVKFNRGIKAASITAVVYLIIVAFLANG